MHSPVCTTGRRKNTKHTHTHFLTDAIVWTEWMFRLQTSLALHLGSVYLTSRADSLFFFHFFFALSLYDPPVPMFSFHYSPRIWAVPVHQQQHVLAGKLYHRPHAPGGFATQPEPPLCRCYVRLFIFALSLSLSPHTSWLLRVKFAAFLLAYEAAAARFKPVQAAQSICVALFPIERERERKHRPLFWLSFLNNPKQLSKWY